MREFVYELVLIGLLILAIIIGFNILELTNNEPKHVRVGITK